MPKILISKAFSFLYFYCFVIDKWHNISGELLYTLLKNNQIYEPKKFINPEIQISKLVEEAAGA